MYCLGFQSLTEDFRGRARSPICQIFAVRQAPYGIDLPVTTRRNRRGHWYVNNSRMLQVDRLQPRW